MMNARIRLIDRVSNVKLRRRSSHVDGAAKGIVQLKHIWAVHVSRAFNLTSVNTHVPLEKTKGNKMGKRPPTIL